MLFPLVAGLATLAGLAHATPAPTGRFYLKTATSSPAKSAFDGLYVYAYHTGAGLNDAMLSANKTHASPASALTGSIPDTQDDPNTYFNVLFHLSTTPYALLPAAADTIYAGWQPVSINGGGGGPTNETAFFLGGDNNSSLQWTNTAGTGVGSSFNGWLVCEWWHADIDDTSKPGVQLFFREAYYGTTTPGSCADVDLVLEHV